MSDSNRTCLRTFASRRLWVLLALAVLASVVAAAKVKILAPKKHDVTSYKTYQWLPPRLMSRWGLLEDDPVYAPVIRRAVNQELNRKGYKEVAEGGELSVATGGFSRTTSQLEGFLLNWGFDFYYGDWGATVAAPVSRVNREGTFVIILLDSETKQGVWGGLATALIGKPETVGKSIDKAAKRILKKLPKRRD